MVFIRWIEQLGEAALLTEYKMWTYLASLVTNVKITFGLLIIFYLEDLLEPLEELSLARAMSSMDHHSIAFVLLLENKEFTDISNEGGMLGGFNG
jgi:hypothetical protein